MEWKRYESKIVNVHQVVLVGWPVEDFDPHILSLKDLETCVSALQGPEPACYWQKVGAEEVEQRQEEIAAKKASGEIVTKQHKRWSDIGKKQGKKRARGDDSDKENEGE